MSALRSQACTRCWRRKQKCSRDTPVCVQCREASAACVPRGFGPTLDSGEVVSETGIEALKSRIHSIRMHLVSGNPAVSPAAPSLGPSTTSRETATAPAASSPPGQHEMQPDVAYLSLSAMAEQTDNQSFSTDGLSYLTMLHAATGISGSDPVLPLHDNEALSGSLAEFRQTKLIEVDLGSAEMCTAYQNYVDMVVQTYPFASSDQLSEYREAAITANRDDHAEELPEHLAVAYLGTATGLLLDAHYTHKELLASSLALRAIKLMPKILDRRGSLPALRCLIAIIILSIFTTFGGSTWHLVGLTMTRCISAGLHTFRSLNHQSQIDAQGDRRRLMWALYIIDTCVSTNLDRPFTLSDHEVMIPSPSSTLDDSRNASIEDAAFAHLIEHAQIIRSIRDNASPELGILCRYINIRHWAESTPHSTCLSEDRIRNLLVKALVELLKQHEFLNDLERANILNQAIQEFGSYLGKIEEQLTEQQQGAVPGLEALEVFAIGVILATSEELRVNDLKEEVLLQVQNCLTLFSVRFPVARKYRAIVVEAQSSPGHSRSSSKLRDLVSESDLAIPSQIQRLIFAL